MFMAGQLGLAQGGILPLECFFEGVAVLLLLSEGFFLGDIGVITFYVLQWPLGSMGVLGRALEVVTGRVCRLAAGSSPALAPA